MAAAQVYPGHLMEGFGRKGVEEVADGKPCGPVSRVLYPEKIGTVAIYLAPQLSPGPRACVKDGGRRRRRGLAANPGTSRALIVPLFGLAPGGVWPPLRHRSGRALLPPDFTLTPMQPCGHRGGMFLRHFPSPAPD